jgi:hypothetical protein
MPKRGIATAQTPEHIENTLAWKAPSYKKFLEQELEKLVDSTEQEDGTFVFSLKTLELADYYFTQLKQTQVSDS